MIIIIDEASAKLASFYYHDDSCKKNCIVRLPGKLLDELQKKLSDEQQNNLCVYEIENNSGYTESAKTPRKLIREN